MKIIISETQYKNLLSEYYDEDKLYSRDYVVDRLKKGPKELRKYINNLPSIPCSDSNGNERICTKIPEVIYVFLSGNYYY
jgi:hypothetical protein